MFKKSTPPKNFSITVIGKDTIIRGDIVSTTDCIRVDGTLEGTLKSDKKVVITASGVVKGSIKASCLETKGTIFGQIDTKMKTQLDAGSVTNATIIADIFVVQEDAQFTGEMKMPNVKRIQKEEINTLEQHQKAG